MIKSSVARSIGTTIEKSSQQALQADGVTPLVIVGETRLILSRAGKQLALDALVVDDLDVDALADTPFLIANDIPVRPAKCQVRIQDSEVIQYQLTDDPTTGSHAVRRHKVTSFALLRHQLLFGLVSTWSWMYLLSNHVQTPLCQRILTLPAFGLSPKSWKPSEPKSA